MAYSVYVNVRLSKEQRDALEALAAKHGLYSRYGGEDKLSLSKALRWLMDREIASGQTASEERSKWLLEKERLQEKKKRE